MAQQLGRSAVWQLKPVQEESSRSLGQLPRHPAQGMLLVPQCSPLNCSSYDRVCRASASGPRSIDLPVPSSPERTSPLGRIDLDASGRKKEVNVDLPKGMASRAAAGSAERSHYLPEPCSAVRSRAEVILRNSPWSSRRRWSFSSCRSYSWASNELLNGWMLPLHRAARRYASTKHGGTAPWARNRTVNRVLLWRPAPKLRLQPKEFL